MNKKAIIDVVMYFAIFVVIFHFNILSLSVIENI